MMPWHGNDQSYEQMDRQKKLPYRNLRMQVVNIDSTCHFCAQLTFSISTRPIYFMFLFQNVTKRAQPAVTEII